MGFEFDKFILTKNDVVGKGFTTSAHMFESINLWHDSLRQLIIIILSGWYNWG